jgi:tRNA (guanine-N7-)-methyltransferase
MNIIRSYVQRNGKISFKQRLFFDTYLKTFQFSDVKLTRNIIFELGFGNGDHIIDLLKHHSNDTTIIGCETYIKGIIKVMEYATNNNITNLILYYGDGLELLKTITTINKLYILFPDPWPKLKHHKRRLINETNLKLFKSKLHGELIIATDHIDYHNWILNCFDHINLSILTTKNDCLQSGILTKYAAKALHNNQSIYLFNKNYQF